MDSSDEAIMISSITFDSTKGLSVWKIKGSPLITLNCFFSPNLLPDPAAGIIAVVNIYPYYMISIASP